MALGIAKIYVYQFLKVKDKNNTNLFYAAMPLCRYANYPMSFSIFAREYAYITFSAVSIGRI
jgi:hypothetical protein